MERATFKILNMGGDDDLCHATNKDGTLCRNKIAFGNGNYKYCQRHECSTTQASGVAKEFPDQCNYVRDNGVLCRNRIAAGNQNYCAMHTSSR